MIKKLVSSLANPSDACRVLAVVLEAPQPSSGGSSSSSSMPSQPSSPPRDALPCHDDLPVKLRKLAEQGRRAWYRNHLSKLHASLRIDLASWRSVTLIVCTAQAECQALMNDTSASAMLRKRHAQLVLLNMQKQLLAFADKVSAYLCAAASRLLGDEKELRAVLAHPLRVTLADARAAARTVVAAI